MKALLSVSDKTGILELARALTQMGIGLISTGGTASLLQEHKLQCQEAASLTGFAQMLGGRVKTLHPNIHAALLARRDVPEHMRTLADQHIEPIDVLVCNLYPFESTIAQSSCSLADAIENIDIGGPAMVRSAAKNWQHVAVLTSPSQYPRVIEEMRAHGGKLSQKTLFELAVAAFNRIAQYDGAISDYLSAIEFDSTLSSPIPTLKRFPDQSNGRFIKIQDLRYGENPHQQAAFYRDLYPAPGSLAMAEQIQGKELSYNNIADADTAWECVKQWSDTPACVIVKHANPCGVAIGRNPHEAYTKAFKTDPTSAFGGIIAFNVPVDRPAAQALTGQFIEVLMAPNFSPEALAIFKAKANVRLLRISLEAVKPRGLTAWERGQNAIDAKRVSSGLLLQTCDSVDLDPSKLKVVTQLAPTSKQMNDLLFAWKVAHFVKSNAVVYCSGGMTLGVGAGQMSRVDSAVIAGMKATDAGLSLDGSAVASDAFFPFRDGLDAVLDRGATCIIQPGGSMRDKEVIDAANERGAAMVFTGIRHFRH